MRAYCYGTPKNQGYHLESDVGYTSVVNKCGPAEREEIWRAEMIEAEVEENRRREKRLCKDRTYYD